MQCAACSAKIDASGVFPGVEIACRSCGAKNVAGGDDGAPRERQGTPYRAPQRPAEAADSPRAAHAELRCPRCARALDDADGGLACASCAGTFLDHPAFAARVADADAHRSTAPFVRRRRFDPDVRAFACPRCRKNMERASFGARSGIFLDTCAAHGTWFDPHELEDALHFVSSVGLDAVREAEAKANAHRERPMAPATSTTADPRGAAAYLQVALLAEERREEQFADTFGRVVRGRHLDLMSLIVRHIFG